MCGIPIIYGECNQPRKEGAQVTEGTARLGEVEPEAVPIHHGVELLRRSSTTHTPRRNHVYTKLHHAATSRGQSPAFAEGPVRRRCNSQSARPTTTTA